MTCAMGRRILLAIATAAFALLSITPAHAWNNTGHKVVADIAWEQLTPERRKEIVDVLRRHPRFDEDFAKKMPSDVDEDRWIFQQAAIWPDIARGFKDDDLAKYNRPSWHYVNVPVFIGMAREIKANRSMDYPTPLEENQWNVAQAIKHCQSVLAGNASPADKALAYCWLFHLTGDVHQPLHGAALVCDRFPEGDKGGNSIPVVQGGNLHSLWDGLIGKDDRPNGIKREVAQLHEQQTIWQVDAKASVETWIKESNELAKSFVYSPQIVEAVLRPGELEKINLPKDYLEQAGQKARARVVAAGLRLADVLTKP
jgi:hypothetical protein